METIKFSTSSFWFKYWKFISLNKCKLYYPSDTCSLRKQLILYTLVVLLAFPVWALFMITCSIFPKVRDAVSDAGAPIYTLIGIFHTLSVLFAFAVWSEYVIVVGYLFSILSIFVGGSFIIGISAIIIFAGDKLENRRWNRSFTERKPSIFKVLYQNVKDKVCSRIEWVD